MKKCSWLVIINLLIISMLNAQQGGKEGSKANEKNSKGTALDREFQKAKTDSLFNYSTETIKHILTNQQEVTKRAYEDEIGSVSQLQQIKIS